MLDAGKKYEILEEYVSEEALNLIVNWAGSNHEVLDFIADEYSIDFDEYENEWVD